MFIINMHIYNIIMKTIWHVKTTKNILNPTFDDLTSEHIKNSIETDEYKISSTLDLLHNIRDIFKITDKIIMDVHNIYYDKNTLIQSIVTPNDVNSEIIVKRKLRNNDTFTFMEHDINDQNSVDYEYLDLTQNELLSVLMSKHIHRGIYVEDTGDISHFEYIFNSGDDLFGSILIKMNNKINEIKFLNLQNVMSNLDENEDSGEKINKILSKENSIVHMCSYHNIGVGIITCISQCHGFKINERMKTLFNFNVFGNCYIGLSDYVNEQARIIDLDTNLYNKMMNNVKILNQDYKPKNDVFCNIHNELQ